ncbi:MAG: tripartite tricarboxylate transporter TctB family protein [Beijerinckiaceae bacterium]
MSAEHNSEETPLVSHRAMEIATALLFLLASSIVMFDSWKLGVGWKESEGPAAGYFPFYISILMAFASLVVLFQGVVKRVGADKTFVTREGFKSVTLVLIPLILYVATIQYIGIYVASALYIALFMWHFGKYNIVKGLAVGLGVALSLFAMFEIWFIVSLPKGPLEAYFGY